MPMLSRTERRYLEHVKRFGVADLLAFQGDYPYVLKHRILRKAWRSFQDLKLLAEVYYDFEHPHGSPHAGWDLPRGVSLERLREILEDKFRYLNE